MALNTQEFERLKVLASQRKQTTDFQQGSSLGGTLKETGRDIKETFLGVGKQLNIAGENIVETAQDKGLSLGEKVRGIGAEAFRGGSRAFGEGIIGAGKTLLSQNIEDKITSKVQDIATNIGEQQFVQDLVRDFEALPPNTKREIENALGFAEGLGEIATGGALSRIVKPVLRTAVTGVRESARIAKETASKTLQRVTPQVIKDFQNKLPPTQKKSQIDIMTDTYKKSFVTDNATVNKKLDKISARASSFGDKKVTNDDLIKNMVEEGVFPRVEGKLAKFDETINTLSSRQDRIAENITPLLETIPELTPLDTFRQQTQAGLKSTGIVETFLPTKKEIDRLFTSFEAKFGKDLDATEINEIRIAMNSRTKAFGEETFKQDTANIIASAARRRIDELAPSKAVSEANAEWGRLQQIKKTATIFDNQSIDIGFLGGALGRYIGVIGLSGVGLEVAGPGGLVVAGIAAKLGGDVVAQMLRNKAFSEKAKQLLIDSLKRDDSIVQKLIDEASVANKATLERLLLEAPSTIIAGAKGFQDLSSKISPKRLKELTAQIEAQTTRSTKQQVLNEQAIRFKTKETFIQAVRSNPAWLSKFEEAGTTPENVAEFAFR